MRLLLTSGGLTNESLRRTFGQLVEEPITQAKVAFIPTGANVCTDTSWLDNDIANLRKTGIGAVEMVDLAKLDPRESIRRCVAVDAIWINGGNTYFLLEWVRRSGLAIELPTLLKDRLYVGVSAGSMIAGPTVETNTPIFPEEDDHKIADLRGLGLVSFAVVPHLFSSSFPNSSPAFIERFSATVSYPIYALDDASAVVVIDGAACVVSEGGTRAYNNHVVPKLMLGTRSTL